MAKFDISNFYIFSLVEPEFDLNKFISKLLDENGNSCYIKSSSLRLIDIYDDVLTAEFLYSSQEFYNFIRDFDELLKKQLIEKGPMWFGDKFDTDKINNMFRSTIRLPEHLPGLPLLKFKLSDNFSIVGKDNNRYELDDLKTNMEIKIHFSIEGIEFHKNMCNVSLIVYQININKNLCQTMDNLFYPNSDIINDTESEIFDLIDEE